MADESSEIGFQHDLQFTFRAAERLAQGFIPRGRAQPFERHDGARRDRDEAGEAGRAGVADEPAVAKARARKRETARSMNEGQFKAIVELLTRIAESLENQRPLIIVVPGDANVAELMEELNNVRAPERMRAITREELTSIFNKIEIP